MSLPITIPNGFEYLKPSLIDFFEDHPDYDSNIFIIMRFAGESSNPWTISLRERCRSKFLRGVSTLCRHWEKTGQLEKAVQCYQRGLEADDLAEELYQRLMTCYHRLGRRAEMLSVYERCKRVLSASLGIEPSSETKAIRKSIFFKKS